MFSGKKNHVYNERGFAGLDLQRAGEIPSYLALAMNKRSFIKLFSGTAAAPVVSPLMKLLPEIKLKNWAGNFEYGTQNLYAANSVEQARDFVHKCAKLKVLGTRHCFNKIADSTNQFLSMKPANELLSVNAAELGRRLLGRVENSQEPRYRRLEQGTARRRGARGTTDWREAEDR